MTDNINFSHAIVDFPDTETYFPCNDHSYVFEGVWKEYDDFDCLIRTIHFIIEVPFLIPPNTIIVLHCTFEEFMKGIYKL